MSTRIARFPALLLMLLFLAALALTGFNLSAALPRAQWGAALASPDIDNIQQMLFHYSLLPRLAISFGRGRFRAGGRAVPAGVT
jgi:iron complex transport system permease protein